jgi:hypothetical protein
VNDMANMGCCEGGLSSCQVYVLCQDCGTWNEEEEEWYCPSCDDARATAENATTPTDTPAVAAPAPTMTAAEIAHTAIVGSMDTSSHFFDQWCIFLADRVGEEVMNEMNAAPEIYNAHFVDFLIDQDRATLGLVLERFTT